VHNKRYWFSLNCINF